MSDQSHDSQQGDASVEAVSAEGVQSPDDVVNLITNHWKRTGVSLNCELCGHETWSVLAYDDRDGVGLLLRSGPKLTFPSKYFLAYGAQCEHCGNLRLMSKTAVEGKPLEPNNDPG